MRCLFLHEQQTLTDTTNVTSGAFTFVEKGTDNADNGYVMTTDGTITIGTTAIAWDQFSGAGQVTAGAGLDQDRKCSVCQC